MFARVDAVTLRAERRAILAEARRALGIEHLVLMIHDASFPSRADEESGRGSPYSRGARDLLAWAEDLGFNGVQLGPQGETTLTNPSPYDGTAFAKSVLSIALFPLAHDPAWEGILSPELLEAIVRDAPGGSAGARVDHAYVFEAHRRAIREAHARAPRQGEVWKRFLAWRAANAWWLARDAQYETWTAMFGTDDWRAWPASLPDVPGDEVFELGQFVVHAQHEELVAYANERGFRLFGDLQIGLAHRDRLGRDDLFLPGYALGAPPSRTNPEGQPWGYPVFRPESSEALALVTARAKKVFSEFHGLRVDHPHGHVCPWVYDATRPDALAAVAEGARLFESPDLPDHPRLAPYAIARAVQIDRGVARYADAWVMSLDAEQVARYGRRIALLTDAARAFRRAEEDVLLEVLSTCPYPLARVLEARGLGRFRVLQKADPRDPNDVYSTHQAKRGDWVMLGNHDTPPIWARVATFDAARVNAWCDHLEARLGKAAIDRAAVAQDAAALAQPMLVDLLACDAGRVGVFFADLLGMKESYNLPGVVSADNWTLRAGNDFAPAHAERAARGHALDVPLALAAALRVRGDVALATKVEHAIGVQLPAAL
jgi:4-alpha-glucanotransferase